MSGYLITLSRGFQTHFSHKPFWIFIGASIHIFDHALNLSLQIGAISHIGIGLGQGFTEGCGGCRCVIRIGINRCQYSLGGHLFVSENFQLAATIENDPIAKHFGQHSLAEQIFSHREHLPRSAAFADHGKALAIPTRHHTLKG